MNTPAARNHVHPLCFICFCLFLTTACTHNPVKNTDHPEKSDSLLGMADSLLGNGQLNAARAYLDSAYAGFHNAGPLDHWKRYMHKANFYLNYQFDTLQSRLYTDSMFLAIKGHEEQYKEAYANSLFARGDQLKAEKRYAKAFDYYYSGQVYAENNLDSCKLARFTNQLGLVRYQQGKYLEAIPYLRRALSENGACTPEAEFSDRFIRAQSIWNTIALCYEKAGQPDSAIFYYRKALDFIGRMGKNYPGETDFIAMAKGVVFGNIGGVYGGLGRFDSAAYYLQESILINDRPGFAMSDAQTAMIKLADLQIRLGHMNEASQLISRLEELARAQEGRNSGYDEIRARRYRLRWLYYEQEGNRDEAYHYLRRYYELKDSMSTATLGLSGVDMDDIFRLTEQQFKLELLKKDNQLKSVSLMALVVFLAMAAAILLVVWFHLRRSRKANKEIQAQNEEIQLQNLQMQRTLNALEQSHADNTRMMKIVAHDLRNPIGGITSLADLLLEGHGLENDDRSMLEMIRSSGQNSLEMVDDLLHVHTHPAALHREPVDMHKMLEYCVELLQHKAKAKGQHIALEAGEVTLPVSREKMWRVISNLIANAIKFSPRGAGIAVQMEVVPGKVRISVVDHGIGIPLSLKDKVFDMFTEAKRPGTAGEQTFGLGLAISRQIVEAHGGSIWFESVPGSGTTFFVELNASA